MGLIECSECGHRVSDKAAACPGCGAPVVGVEAVAEQVLGEPAAEQDAVSATVSAQATDRTGAAGQAFGIAGVVLGLAALVMPYFAAVFLVPAAVVCGVIAILKGKKGLGMWAIVAAGIGLIAILAISQQISDTLGSFGSPSSTTSGSGDIVTAAEYRRIQEGMSYSDVVRVIGSHGQELSSSEVAGYITIMYSWENPDGSNMNAMSQNGELVTKAQFGLDQPRARV
jgi:hypothetical protein